jgi:hypothetical protein
MRNHNQVQIIRKNSRSPNTEILICINLLLAGGGADSVAGKGIGVF